MQVTVNEKNTTAEVVGFLHKFLLLNPAVAGIRKAALETFQRLGMPDKKSEEYKHTPITRLLQKNLDLENISEVSSELDPSPFFIPGVAGNRIVLINGVYAETHSHWESPTDELYVSNLSAALAAGDPLAHQHFGQHADYETDAFAAWNTASWNHGVFIRIPEGKIVEQPIIIYHVHDTTEGSVISATRNLIVIGNQSTVTVIEKFDAIGDANHFSNTITEAVVGENAGLELYTIQNDSSNRYQVGLTNIHQANSSRVNTFTFTLGGQLIRNTLQLALDGEGIESHMYGLYLIAGDTIADNHTVVDHRKPNSYSNEIYKGIMDDRAKGVFNGKIYVRPQAQKTNAFQANRNILLSNQATVNTKPQLEIWADDVKCSHGCTTGQLDDEAVFYLRARGIHKDTARAMMLYAFALEVLNNIKHPELKVYLDQLVSERLHKNF